MAAQKGKSMVLKIGDGATAEAFTTIGGMRTNALTINGETVDITDKDSNGWRELLEQAGVKSVSMTGAGVFKDSASEGTARTAAMNQTIDNYRMQFQDGKYFAGPFQITSLEYTGEYNGSRQFSMSFESAGTITYV